jgi:hypothetical protein
MFDGETDIAVILTEGIVKDIVAGNPKIVQVYVDSPLLGIRQQMLLMYIADLENTKVAISRLGSVSQLMALMRNQNGYNKLRILPLYHRRSC